MLQVKFFVTGLKCSSNLEPYNCEQSGVKKKCYSLPPVKSESYSCPSSVKVNKAPICARSQPETYDYFTGSGASYILSFLFLFLFIVGK